MTARAASDATALALSPETTERILRRLADGVTIQDASGRLLYANDAAAAILGFATPAELLATPTADLLARFEIADDQGRPFPLDRLPGRVALATGASASETLRYRVRSTGHERWSIVHATAILDGAGAPELAINVFHDITEHRQAVERSQRSEERLHFLAEAGALLASSLDYEATLASLARLVVPRLADWCAIDMLSDDGRIERLAVVHSDPEKVRWAEQLRERHPPDPGDDLGVPRALRTGEAQLLPEIAEDIVDAIRGHRPELADVLAALGLRSAMIVPLAAHGRILGAITFISAESGRHFAETDLRLAEELARRAALAIDNARAYGEVEARAEAVDALRFVADGIALVDRAGVVRLWNPAAAAITGIPAERIVGRRPDEAASGWDEVERRVPVSPHAGEPGARATTLPVDVEGRELWLSLKAVAFESGTVYAFRDMTEEHALDRVKSEFVATVSHELRTPLAAIYGAAVTLQRPDLPADHPQRTALTEVIASETERLSGIVDGILWASALESGTVQVSLERCDPAALVDDVLATARLSAPPSITLERVGSNTPPAIRADPAKLVQVLTNLVDNAIKYSPDGSRVTVDVQARDVAVGITVRDEGIGIPPGETERIFEKFHRLDPELTRGVSGTGLGLYICRELLARMNGSIRAERRTNGSDFVIELPRAE
jgi:PAS domain S-box-containing protein